MSKDLNDVTIIGNLVRDPEIKYTVNNKAVCKISIANNQDFGDKKYTNFFDATAWDKLAETCNQYLKKGNKVAIKGTLRQERWEHEGKTMSKIGILINEIQFLYTKPSENTDNNQNNNTGNFSGNPYKNENSKPDDPYSYPIDGSLKDDDIPF